MNKWDIDTPALLIDLDCLERNIEDMASFARHKGINLRPMVKTHKSPDLAKMQIEAGAKGILLAKLGEAEVMADAGVKDINIAYPLIGEQKLSRAVSLIKDRGVKLRLTVDDVKQIEPLSAKGVSEGIVFSVLIKIDTGVHRLGLPRGERVIELAKRIEELPGLSFQGISTHAGHVYTARSRDEIEKVGIAEGEIMVGVRDDLEKAGIKVDTVATGSTPTAKISGNVKGVNEIRPGNYIFYDAKQVSLGVVDAKRCAATVLATVISRPAPDRAVIDAGSKALSSDPGAEAIPGFGLVVGRDDLLVKKLSEEVGVVELTEPKRSLEIGGKLEIIPNHICVVFNLFDEAYGIRNDRVERTFPISARGKVT